MKILIAEDNAFSRTLLKKTLVKAGYDAVVAENGDVAWELLTAENDPPKLALIDWMMPGMSGIELCRRLREQESAIPVYVILLTAKSDKEDVLEGFAAGADDFIKKPFDSGELLARIKVGRRLVEQQALMHGLIDAIPDPIYVKDNRGLYIGCNKAYVDFVGAELEEIYGRTASDVLPGTHAQQSHMEDLRVMAGGGVLESEGWVDGAQGKVYHNTVKIPYLESSDGSTGMIGISRDLTKRMEMEQEMRRLAVAVEQSTEAIMISDVDGKILYANAALENTTGYAQEELVGQPSDILKSGRHNSEFYQKLWDTISAGNKWEGRFTNRRKDGILYEEESVIYPIRDAAGDVTNYVSISRDITKEAAIEKHLRQQQKMNAVGELAGGVSHDFNNILTAILGYVALCMNRVEEDDKVYSYLQEITKAGDRAAKLVRQILSFSRQEEQQFHSLELQPIIEDSLSLVQTTLKKNIKLVKVIDPACGAVFGDTTQLQQVMVNLCTNAAHALGKTEPGSLTVKLESVEITAESLSEKPVELEPGSYACITVVDTGCGMPHEVQERIFEPYYTTKKQGEGTGFGLSIVHGIVRKHRGAITVDSEVGKGSVFTLYFPLLKDPSVHASEEDEKTAPKKVEARGRILFVDDDQTILSMGREILESYGYSVITATNGRRAMDTFSRDPSGFDAVVTDYSMPEMNGHELIKKVKALRSDIPTMLCSGYMEKVEGEDLSSLGHTAYMAKPTDWRLLNQTIQDGINKEL